MYVTKSYKYGTLQDCKNYFIYLLSMYNFLTITNGKHNSGQRVLAPLESFIVTENCQHDNYE